MVKSHGINCSRCLDVESGGRVDLFDCKAADPNQLWDFTPAQGASVMKRGGLCLVLGGDVAR